MGGRLHGGAVVKEEGGRGRGEGGGWTQRVAGVCGPFGRRGLDRILKQRQPCLDAASAARGSGRQEGLAREAAGADSTPSG